MTLDVIIVSVVVVIYGWIMYALGRQQGRRNAEWDEQTTRRLHE